MKQFILGGARSGKSRYAEKIAETSGKTIIYIATATAGDDEMKQRILFHKQQRPDHWKLVEEPIKISEVLRDNDNADCCLLVDCLTLWLSNCLTMEGDINISQQQDDLINTISNLNAELILVSNEVGQGIVPMSELGRIFVDESGRLHQKLAQVCDNVVFITAGLPQILK